MALEKRYKRPRARANIIIYLLDHAYEAPLANIKMELCHGNKLLGSFCGVHLAES